jgi:phosphatidylglycerophosphatase C
VRTVAAFDFDGTICRGDAVIPFLNRLRGPVRTAGALASLVPLLPTRNRDVLRRAMSKRLLSGVPAAQLDQTGREFGDYLIDNKMFPSAKAKLQEHASAGHEIIVVSASYDAYLKRIAERLNIDTLICTRIEVIDGTCTGRLVEDINVRSHKKTELLMKALGDDEVELYAYGNSSGDVPMLAAAAHPFWMNRSGHITAWTAPDKA